MISDYIQCNEANYQTLSPVTMIERSALAFPDRVAIYYGDITYTWLDYYSRCKHLAAALKQLGIGKGDVVSVMSPNTPAMLEMHFGVPMSGGVLNTINYRLDASTIAFILEHCEAKILFVDSEFGSLAQAALSFMDKARRPMIVDIEDSHYKGGHSIGMSNYESLLSEVDLSSDDIELPSHEFDPVCLNYTSGTTGKPKGVIYHHRGAYLSALGNALTFGLNANSVYLWTLPLFHCNGWSQVWAMAAVGGSQVCLRGINAEEVLNEINRRKVTHLAGAPVVFNILVDVAQNTNFHSGHIVNVATGGAPPPKSLISAMESIGFSITHLYGLTESFGPSLVCARTDEWHKLARDDLANKLSRQGVRLITDTAVEVRDPKTLERMPRDGRTRGEIMIRSNGLMAGYLKNADATEEVFKGGWFHTGDIAVVEADGCIRVTDRLKDIIISGGENISSIEIEEVLYAHPSVLEASVVAKSDLIWGETPCAFVFLKEGFDYIDDQILIEWCRKRLATYKVPKYFIFGELPKTATGKVQKFLLRNKANTITSK